MPSGTPALDDLRTRSLAAQVERARAEAGPMAEVLGPQPDEGAVTGDGDVLAIQVLSSAAWDRPALRRLCRRLASGPRVHRLVFVEPVQGRGWRSPVWRARDLPADLRSVGFMITTLDRFAVGPARFRLRSYAFGIAVPDTVGWAPRFGRGQASEIVTDSM